MPPRDFGFYVPAFLDGASFLAIPKALVYGFSRMWAFLKKGGGLRDLGHTRP